MGNKTLKFQGLEFQGLLNLNPEIPLNHEMPKQARVGAREAVALDAAAKAAADMVLSLSHVISRA